MMNLIFILSIAGLLYVVFRWAFRVLPDENWQIIASVPKTKTETGQWESENFTYYGFFNATAYVLSLSIFFVLLSAVDIPLIISGLIVVILLAICVPSSRIIARIVENKKYTFTVGGASFVGIVASPWVVWLTSGISGIWTHNPIPVLPVLAAISIAYAFGEGFGRLACISFGCCYGKPVSECHPMIQRLFEHRHFVFSGKTKKIAYAHRLDGEKVIPIQAITSVIYCGFGLIGIALFLMKLYFTAFFIPLVVTQVWRLISEFFRADYRGDRKISAYQIMGVISVFYGIAILFIFPSSTVHSVSILNGLKAVWNPVIILFLQFLWISIFWYTGRSQVTRSITSFHVVDDRI